LILILDTNVVSELMRVAPDRQVRAWIAAQKSTDLALSAITIAEIQRGLARLPKGKRRKNLEANFLTFVTEAFAGRVFPFDEAAALIYGEIAAGREKNGYAIDAVDLMIAAVAKIQNASIATRNTNDFEGCGIALINPWDMKKN